MDSFSIENMYCDNNNHNQELINVNEETNSIYFNAGVNSKTMSTLIEELISLEQNILKKQKTLKRKIYEARKTDKDKDKDKDKDDDEQYYENNFEIKIEPKPITLYITTNGGYIHQVFSAIDTIRGMKIPVNTVCKGFVASAGTLLSLAGKKRFITENSYMLIHELKTGNYGKFTYLSESHENSKQLMEHIKSYYLARTKMTSEELDEQLKKDIYWNAQICLEKGLVDEILKY